MAPQWTTFTATPVFARPAIRFPGSGTIGEIEIPLHLTKLGTQNEGSQISQITSGTVLDVVSNLGSGGTAVGYGANQLSKIQMEGWIDTPSAPVQSYGGLFPAISLYPSPSLTPGQGQVITNLPLNGIIIDGNNVSYAEIIAAYFEGRTTNAVGQAWTMVFPKWFRDGYGRVYGDGTPTGRKGFIRILNFTADYIEAIPSRMNFTMMLQVQ